MTREVVVVSREWNSPQIKMSVTAKAIGIEMPLPDFIFALAQETGSPATLLTVEQLRRRLAAAADEVVRKMKLETTKVM